MRNRNYRKEYDDMFGKPGSTASQRTAAQNQHRRDKTSRNKARKYYMDKGICRVGDGKDVDHINEHPTDNNPKNLRVMSKSKNRARK